MTARTLSAVVLALSCALFSVAYAETGAQTATIVLVPWFVYGSPT